MTASLRDSFDNSIHPYLNLFSVSLSKECKVFKYKIIPRMFNRKGPVSTPFRPFEMLWTIVASLQDT